MRALGEAKVQDLESLVALPAGAERTLELRPRGHTAVRGTLSWSEGALPEVVPVRLFPQRAQASRWGDGLRGGLAVRGVFALDGIEPGTWIVVAYPAPREGPELRGSAVIEVPAEGEVAVELTVQPRRSSAATIRFGSGASRSPGQATPRRITTSSSTKTRRMRASCSST